MRIGFQKPCEAEMNLRQYFKMGTYATYVWSAYGLTAGTLGVIVWLAKRKLAKEVQRARRR